jgi:hypothetical protein
VSEKLYLKVSKHNGYDDFYYRLSDDKTWKEILGQIELVLDAKFFDNDEKLKGIKIECEVVNLTDSQYENILWHDKE